MKDKYSYARLKLRETIYALATGPGDIRTRLTQVYNGFFYIEKIEFPMELQTDWEWIQKELKRFRPIIREDGSIFIGAVENTCNRIKNKTGIKIAERLLKIYKSLEFD